MKTLIKINKMKGKIKSTQLTEIKYNVNTLEYYLSIIINNEQYWLKLEFEQAKDFIDRFENKTDYKENSNKEIITIYYQF